MNDDVKEQLDTAISSELDALATIDVGSEAYKTTVDGITKLIDRRNEMDKIDLEVQKQKISEEKEKELNDFNKKNQLITHAISIGGILIPVFVTIWGTYKTLKFEETGTVTTIMGRGFINKLLPKK